MLLLEDRLLYLYDGKSVIVLKKNKLVLMKHLQKDLFQITLYWGIPLPLHGVSL